MQFDRPFLKLPIRFDAEAIAAEVRALPASAWVPHPTGYVGNEAVRLISVGGAANDQAMGAMAPTEHLAACPYVRQIMAELGGVWGRSRFMGLGAGGQVPRHVDSHIYWRTHLRIHIPAITNDRVVFHCGDEMVHMAPGECWLFDSFRWHEVRNDGDAQRVHLVIDTVGGGRLPELITKAKAVEPVAVEMLAPGQRGDDRLRLERENGTPIMSPWELRAHVGFLLGHAVDHPALAEGVAVLDRFIDAWNVIFTEHGQDPAAAAYRAEVDRLQAALGAVPGYGEIRLTNNMPLKRAFADMVIGNLIRPVPPTTPR